MADTLKTGDTLPKLTKTLQNADGSLVDLTDAVTILLIVERRGSTSSTTFAMSVEGDPEGGVVSYQWVEGDTVLAGRYLYTIRVIWNTGDPQSFPARGYGCFILERSLDD